MELAVRSTQTLNGNHLATTHSMRERGTGVIGGAVDHYRAGPALGTITTQLCAGETELVTQCHRQCFLRQHIHAPQLSVHIDGDQALHSTGDLPPPRSATCEAAHDETGR